MMDDRALSAMTPRLLRAIGLAILCTPAIAQSPTACFSATSDPSAKIAACTETLAAPALPKEAQGMALAARAEAYASSHNNARALADYDAALILIPGDIAALMARGRLRELSGDTVKAESDYTAVIAVDPTIKQPAAKSVYARRGALRVARGAVEPGIADLAEAKRFDPSDPSPYKLRGAYFLKKGDAPQALTELSGAVERDARDTETLIARATAFARLRQLPAAIADFTAALELAPRNLSALEGRGVARLQAGEAQSAVADFSVLVSLNPDNLQARAFRADARLQAGNLPDAEEDFSAVLAKRPDDTDARMGRAVAREFAANFAGAESDLTQILDRDNNNARALTTRGQVRFMAGNHGEALKDFARAAGLPGAATEVPLWRFVAESRAGQRNLAVLDHAVTKMPIGKWPTPVVLYFRGALTGDQMLAQAEADAGHRCEAYFWLGQAALLVGDTAEAARLFRAAVATKMTRFTEFAAAQAELTRLPR